MVLIKEAPEPDVPATVGDENNTLTLELRPGAALGATAVEVYDAGDDAGAPLLQLEIQEDGSSAVTVLPRVPGERYRLVAPDRAGHMSEPREVAVPGFSLSFRPGMWQPWYDLSQPPTYSYQNFVDIDVSGDRGVAEAVFMRPCPEARLADPEDGCAAYSPPYDPSHVNTTPPVDPLRWQYSSRGDEAERPGQAVVRVVGGPISPGVLHPDSRGTSAALFSFDFTPPTVDLERVVVHQNDPGTDDEVEGLPGAVTDNVGAMPPDRPFVLFVVTNLGGVATGPLFVREDGSFGPVSVGDNATGDVRIRARDGWDNEAESQSIRDERPRARVSGTIESRRASGSRRTRQAPRLAPPARSSSRYGTTPT